MMNDEEEARSVVDKTFYKKNIGSDSNNSPTDKHIWDLKETPSWDKE
eukprot:CAMPEP_0184855558 /NCGR_PEP_ID=MMETSP0580-20130426/767_1 /TAXON_ID=1118495 /ORGANISM="Dactyliosolen fragilissimus" /LENGTH=46 /DNA_ID= /DNA_START= /DNA_END= /DNA_ORIENTATION=